MPFKYPDNLPDDRAELQALRAEAVKAFNEIYDAEGTPTADEFEQLQYITDGLDGVDAALAEYTAADDRAAEVASMAERMGAYSTEDGDGDGEGDDGTEAEAKRKAKAKAEADPEDGGDDDGEQDDDGEDNGVQADARRRTDFSRAAGGQRRDLPPAEGGFRLTTSAQNFETGPVDTLRVAREFGHLATGRAARVVGQNGRSETTLAYVERQLDEFTIKDEAHALSVLDAATDESRLSGGSLTAAGGWVSPSETMYEFLPTLAASDLLSLPEVGVARGGIKFPKEPDFSAMYAAVGFHQTEAQAQAGTEKPCYEIPGADFEEVRLDVVGICLTAGILQDKAWPELTAKYVAEALRAHQHKVSARRIGKLVEGSADVGTLTGPIFGAVGAVLSALELQVTDMRTRHRIPRTQSVEGVAPVWLLGVLRADLAHRQGVLPEQVTDAQIVAHFANLGANVQFVVDWQTDVIGTDTPATAWPTEVQVILYPAGTWWSAVEPVVNIGVTHDSTMLRQNKQVQLFTEDGVAVGKRGPESRLVTIPVNPNGEVGPRHGVAATPDTE